MKYLIAFWGLLIVNLAWGQTYPSQIWHEGKLVLMEGDTIRGQIKYDLENDLVQLNINNTIQTYSARKILFFEIFDQTIDNYRYFYALPYNVQPDYKVPLIFEVLYEGELSLLVREEIVMETAPQYSTFYQPTFYSSRTRLDFQFYFLDKTGNIDRYTMKKGDLLSHMKKKSSQVKQYMKKNNLKHDRKNDLFRIIAYYNALLAG
jgi:hypothetical protein